MKIIGFFLFITMGSLYGMESYDKYWSVAVITGSLSKNTPVQYYMEPQLRLINDGHVFNQLFLLGGLGYPLNASMTFYLGPGLVLSKTPQGHGVQEQRWWEQLNWILVNSPGINLNSRTRLEERKDMNVSPVSIRLRERIWMKMPFKNSEKYAFSLFNEFFFNLNHPQWVSPYVFEQNRTFIGLSTQISSSTVVDVGYLNQYIHAVRSELNHVLWLNFTVNG